MKLEWNIKITPTKIFVWIVCLIVVYILFAVIYQSGFDDGMRAMLTIDCGSSYSGNGA